MLYERIAYSTYEDDDVDDDNDDNHCGDEDNTEHFDENAMIISSLTTMVRGVRRANSQAGADVGRLAGRHTSVLLENAAANVVLPH